MRGGVGRLIDGYAEGLISKVEFEPRLAGLRRRVARLEAEATALQDAAEQARSLQLVIGKLETFAALVQDRLDGADWTTRRDIICTLVRRIEIDGQHVRVVFRVDPGPRDDPASRRSSQHCPGRGGGLVLETAAAGGGVMPQLARHRRSPANLSVRPRPLQPATDLPHPKALRMQDRKLFALRKA